jgi:hypothetical protein
LAAGGASPEGRVGAGVPTGYVAFSVVVVGCFLVAATEAVGTMSSAANRTIANAAVYLFICVPFFGIGKRTGEVTLYRQVDLAVSMMGRSLA